MALPLAFGHVALDQHHPPERKARRGCYMYLPISLGTVVLILVVLWLVGGI
jgi:hypothetical protein